MFQRLKENNLNEERYLEAPLLSVRNKIPHRLKNKFSPSHPPKSFNWQDFQVNWCLVAFCIKLYQSLQVPKSTTIDCEGCTEFRNETVRPKQEQPTHPALQVVWNSSVQAHDHPYPTQIFNTTATAYRICLDGFDTQPFLCTSHSKWYGWSYYKPQ